MHKHFAVASMGRSPTSREPSSPERSFRHEQRHRCFLNAVSSSGGEYLFQDLPLGTYTISVTASGFKPEKVDSVPVTAGVIYTLPIKLNVASTRGNCRGHGERLGPRYHVDDADSRCGRQSAAGYAAEWP